MFRTSDPAVLTSIEVPKPIQSKSNEGGAVIDDNVSKILKFIYNNQNFEVIKNDINEGNVAVILNQAYVMKCEKLIEFLVEMITGSLLTPENATRFYLDSILVSVL